MHEIMLFFKPIASDYQNGNSHCLSAFSSSISLVRCLMDFITDIVCGVFHVFLHVFAGYL
jgi:hypothetical protein